MKIAEVEKHIGEEWAREGGGRLRILGVASRRDSWSQRQYRLASVMPLYRDGTEPKGQEPILIEARHIDRPWAEYEEATYEIRCREAARNAIAERLEAALGSVDIVASVRPLNDREISVRLSLKAAEALTECLEATQS